MSKQDLKGVAVRRNELMLGSYRVSVWAQRFFLLLISKIEDNDPEDKVYRLSVPQLAEVIEVDHNVYRTIFGIVQELAGTWVTVESLDDPNKPIPVGLIVNRMDHNNLRHEGGTFYTGGEVFVSLHRELLPYVKRLRERFTKTELEYAFRLRSTFSQRLYDIFKTQEFHGHSVEWSIDELRSMLNMKTGEMARFPDFRRYVIERGLKEINERTDLHVSYKAVKTGRSISKLAFHIAGRKKGSEAVTFKAGNREDDLYRKLTKVGMPTAEAVRLVEQWSKSDPERIIWHLDELARQTPSGKVKNPVAWLRAAIKADYRPQGSLFDQKQKTEERKAEQAERDRDAARRNRPAGPEKGVRALGDVLKEIVDPKLKAALNAMEAGVAGRRTG